MAAYLAMRSAGRGTVFGPLLVLVALLSGPAAAAKPRTVAVMPFRDLAGGSKFIGGGDRETGVSGHRTSAGAGTCL